VAKVSTFLITLALIAGMAGCGGSGSAIKIRTWYDLDDVRTAMTENYVLMNDLDSTTAGYEELASPIANGGKGWEPIGGSGWGDQFYGSFDGNGYKICDLFINRPLEHNIALFGRVGQGVLLKGVIKNVGVVNFTVTGDVNVAGLVAATWIANTVTNCYATGTVTGGSWVGGLMGCTHNGSDVSSCYFTGSVVGGGQVGGLVGSNDGDVSDSYATGSVVGSGVVGGLVGLGGGASTVTNCYATGNVTDKGYGYVGGLVGSTDGTVSDSYATGTVTGSHYVGGLAGIAENVNNCYATGNVTGDEVIGGLVGWHNDGTVSYSYATGNVAGSYSGGLVGVNGECWVSGGLVEFNDNDSVAIYYCYSTGSVTGDTSVGGLVGENAYSTVSNSYSSGNVTGGSRVGGLVGWHWGDVSNSYAIGSVTGDTSVGGLVGDSDSGTVSNSFWDTETSGQNTSDGGTGKNTTQMKDIATFSGAGWSIVAVDYSYERNTSYTWNIVHTVTYPFLSWQPV